MHRMQDVQEVLPEAMPDTFCLAPFISTMQTPYGKTSPCAYGVTEWQMGELTPAQRWDNAQVNQMRMQFARGETPEPCRKCQSEEQANKDSLRLRMHQWFPDEYDSTIRSGRWQSGPVLVSTKVSNVCNIACRSCAGWDSNRFRDEGTHYLRIYGTQHPNTPGNRFIPRLPPRHTDYSLFPEIASNIRKLEFFGGEPLLNLTHLDLLQQLIDAGRSRDITIFYSTNCTQAVNPRLTDVWQHFGSVEFSLSIDHVGDKFEYLRWPASWSDVERNVHQYLELPDKLGVPMRFVVASCATLNNAYYIDEVVDWANTTVGSSYINMVAFPHCLALHVAPDYVKQVLRQQINNREVLGFLDLQPGNPLEWRRWMIWNKRQDLYRQQDFATVFPEFYQVIREEWDALQDLSEENFNGEV